MVAVCIDNYMFTIFHQEYSYIYSHLPAKTGKSHLILVAPNVLDPASIAILPWGETMKHVNKFNRVAKGLGFIWFISISISIDIWYTYLYTYIYKSKDTKHACIWFWSPSCSFQNTAMPSYHNMFISFNTLLARHYKTPKLQHPRTTQIQKLCKGICKKSHVNLPSCFHPSHQDTNCDFFKWVWGGCSGTFYIFELGIQ